MKRQLIYIMCCVTALFSTISCSDLLEVHPGQSVPSEISLDSREGFESATMGVYARLRSTSQYGNQLIVRPEIMSNTAAHSGTSTTLLNHSRNARLSHMTPWATGYNAISQANAILDGLETFEADEHWKKSIAGQVHFLRALFYHNLTKVYAYDPSAIGSRNRGAVPLILESFESWEDVKGIDRPSLDEMYDFLYAELEKAYDYLSETTDAGRAPQFATAGAAAAIFSRVALHRGDWPKVVEEAEKAIASGVGRLSTAESYHSDWRVAFHPESMFELEFMPADNVGANNAVRVSFTNRIDEHSDVPNGNGYAMVSDMLYEEYELNDARRTLIMKGADRESDKWQMTKFFSRSGAVNLDNIPVIRLSEVYLNRAEAYANMLGMANESMADVNHIRTNRGLGPVSGLIDDVLLDEIWQQRRLELAFEGHSWFDYKRTGRNILKPNGTTFSWSDYRILSRIPLREVRMHSELRQNGGY